VVLELPPRSTPFYNTTDSDPSRSCVLRKGSWETVSAPPETGSEINEDCLGTIFSKYSMEPYITV